MHDSYNICRSCLSSDCGLLSLESLIDGSLTIKDCLKAHLSVNITDDDGLPQKVCLNCFDSLLHIRKFHLQYLQSEEFLLEQYLESCRKADILDANREYEFVAGAAKTENEYLSEIISTTASDESRASSNAFDALNTAVNSALGGHGSGEITINDLSGSLKCFAEAQCKSQDAGDGLSLLVTSMSGKEEVIMEFEHMEGSALELISINGTKIENTGKDGENAEETQIENKITDEHMKDLNRKPSSKLVFCLQCNQQFENRNELRNHFHSVHEEDNARGFCTQCSTILPSRGALMTHLYEHSLAKSRLTCSYCDRTFGDREKVVAHERTHTGEKPFVCKVCGRAFRQSSVLGTHMSLHTGKTVQCPRCDKKFSRNSILKVHLRTHDDIRPYECHMCDKKYRMKCHLNSHLATHSNARNFICEQCGKACKTKDFLRSHMSVHTRPYKCPKCPLETSTTHNLRIHLVKMHGIHDDPKQFKKPTPIQLKK